MAEEFAKQQQYQYIANSNLVLQADRTLIPRRRNEPTGEPDSLWGKVNRSEFGSRAAREVRDTAPKPKKAAAGKNTMDLDKEFEGLVYRPTTAMTREAYELILTVLVEHFGDQSQEVIRSAADAIIQVLKTDGMKDFDKKREVDNVLGARLSSEAFANLTNLAKRLVDYLTESEQQQAERAQTRDLDEGVAVVFDDEDEDEGEEGGDTDEEQVETMAPSTARNDMFEEALEEVEATVARNDDAKPKEVSALLPVDIDAFWTQRLVARFYSDQLIIQEKSEEIMAILAAEADDRHVQNELMRIFDYAEGSFDAVSLIAKNKDAVYWCSRLAKAGEAGPERQSIVQDMKKRNLTWILDDLNQGVAQQTTRSSRLGGQGRPEPMDVVDTVQDQFSGDGLDLEALAFSQGSHVMTNKTVRLPEGSVKRPRKGFEEIHVPPAAQRPLGPGESLVPISKLPEWAQPAFHEMTHLNRIQSRVCEAALHSDGNILLCAPTGAGKTNVALLTILREIGKAIDPATGKVDLASWKAIYIAPMKALVQEMVKSFSKRLKHYGITVAELTGDRQMTREQIVATQIIVTTPEKWDVITRKGNDRSYTKLVRLVIVDEIHLLHDDRGPVLESIISRTLRGMDHGDEAIRLVGLSATLPNYTDVADFLRVQPNNLFHFDGSFRPCPLKTVYVGITEKKALKRYQVMNEVTFEKVMESAGKHQTIVFVHSRKDTVKTAEFIRDMAIERSVLDHFVPLESANREILRTEALEIQNAQLKELVPYGFGVHHAGLSRNDRSIIEDLFTDGRLQVLVSTATLAWGVNLPAHTVIIKGTQVYSPEKGQWVELSSQDVLQMLGRAGRPQFDTYGEGIIITSHAEVQFYLSLINDQLPLESQYISKLVDNLNAEIVLGNIRDRKEAIDWLGYTYLYIRMLKNGEIYGVHPQDASEDPTLVKRRADLVHSAAVLLDRRQLVKYDRRGGKFASTELGRIASHYYISHGSMATYNQHIRSMMSSIELLRVFSLSEEFKHLQVRQEEKMELAKLVERVPIPVKEGVEDASAKINVLLQAYISQLKLEGFALISDMVYVTQSAARLTRAIFEICLRKGWAQLTRRALDLCKMVEKRQWPSMSPLRQIPGMNLDLVRRLEKKDFSFERLVDLNPQELGELVNNPKAGKVLHKYIHQFPRLELQAHIQPLTRTTLHVDLTITPDFQWDTKVHGKAEMFWILVEDTDGERLLYQDQFLLRSDYIGEAHHVNFTVPVSDKPTPPAYFISLVSDRWLQCEARLPVSLQTLILPEKHLAHTELLDLQPLDVSALRSEQGRKAFEGWTQFNAIQTQVFNALYSTDENAFVGAPTGSGKTACAEFAMLRNWEKNVGGKIVYVVPLKKQVELRVADWQKRYGSFRSVMSLTGETTSDIKILDVADVVCCLPTQWDAVSRRWRQRKQVQNVSLFLFDDIHMIDHEEGAAYEVIVSRTRYMASQTGLAHRIVALSVPTGAARDFSEWLGCGKHAMFNFHPMLRPVPLDIHIQSFSVSHFASLMLAMARPVYVALTSTPHDPAIVFVPSRKQVGLSAIELKSLAELDATNNTFIACPKEHLTKFVEQVDDAVLRTVLPLGIGIYHENLTPKDKRIVEHLFTSNAIRVIVASSDSCSSIAFGASTVIVMGMQYFHGKEHRYMDYDIPSVLRMIGRAGRQGIDESSRVVLMCHVSKKDYFKKFINDALPVESVLDHHLHDALNAEIVVKTIENKQDAVDYLTWTFLYRRMPRNPNYYGLQGVTHRHLSDHLSELVESTLNDLSEAKCILIEDEMDLSPLNLGMIASYYNVQYATVEMFCVSLTEKTRMKGLLEIVASAAEFEHITIRHHEDVLLRKLHDRVPVKLTNPNFYSPAIKVNLLLQAHFSRIDLPADLAFDQADIVLRAIPLLQACVDVVSSSGWLTPALSAMELAQMCVQALWNRDSPLKQLPFFSNDVIARCQAQKVESVFDVAEMEDALRSSLLQMNSNELHHVARFVNRYPSIELVFKVLSQDIAVGDKAKIQLSLVREGYEETTLSPVVAPYFPRPKEEGWWIVVGDPANNALLGIKRITLQQKLDLVVDFIPQQEGPQSLTLYFMCDSYLGCDQEYPFEIAAQPGQEDDEDAMEED